MSDIPDGQPPTTIIKGHMSIGATILILMLVRLVWRLTHPVPSPPDDIPRWKQILSRLNHYYFYAALIAMPLLGLAWASAKGWQVWAFGIIPLPKILSTDPDLAGLAGRGHAYLGILTVILALVHASAAVHYKLAHDDQVMERMLPE